METEVDQEIIKAAQDRLLEKRRELGLSETGAPTRLTTSSRNEFELIVAKIKCRHGVERSETCPECEEESRAYDEAREKRAAEEAERREIEARKDAEREAERIRERFEHPEIWLQKYGVPKKFISCSFDSFKGGEKIKEILRTFPEQSILLSGTTGSGKTHLAIATLRGLVQRDAIPKAAGYFSEDAVFTTVPDLLLAIRSSFSRNDDEAELVGKYTNPAVLVLDDLGADKATEWAITTLYLIIDKRNKELQPTIITTNLTMQEIENQYGARIASRLSDMRIINIAMPDYRKRRRGIS